MYRACGRIGGLVTVLALAGCGETAPETGTVPFKASNSPAIEGLNKQMVEQAKKGVPANKKEETPKPAPDAKAADTKPAADSAKTPDPKKE